MSAVLLSAHRVVVVGRTDVRSLVVLGVSVRPRDTRAQRTGPVRPNARGDGDRAPPGRDDAANGFGQRLASAGILVATAVAVLLPWVVPNLVRFERPALLSTNDGTTLLGSYCDASFFGPNKGGWTLECVFEHPTYDIDVDATVRGPRQRDGGVRLRDGSSR